MACNNMEITGTTKLEAIKALIAFVERTGFEDFTYEIETTFSSSVTCYELSLLDNQKHPRLSIRVKVISDHYNGATCEVEISGETIKLSSIKQDTILEAIGKSINTYKAKQNEFLKKISKL